MEFFRPPTNRKYRIHFIGLMHVPTSEVYNSCAFSQKMVKMCSMLMKAGHEVYFYGTENSKVECTEFIQVQSLEDIRKAWGEGNNKFELGYNWQTVEGFKYDVRTAEQVRVAQQHWQKTADEINKRVREQDFVFTMGTPHSIISKQITRTILKVEWGIGYRHSCEKFRVFESSYIQNYIYGAEAGLSPNAKIANVSSGNFYDRVIPNYFNPDHYHLKEKKDDYFLYLGRLTPNKGIYVAIRLAEEMGLKLKLAGQGELLENKSKNVEFVGYADIKMREELMQNAKAIFYPTLYLEPFGGVAVEAGLCGTPVITTNFGAFPEIVENGVNGYRCDTYADFIEAVRNIDKIDPVAARKRTERYLMPNVWPQYQNWLDDVYEVYEGLLQHRQDAWYNIRPNQLQIAKR